MDDLLNRLRAVDPPGGNEHSTRWHRNPDGPEAAGEIERLQTREQELEAECRAFREAYPNLRSRMVTAEARVRDYDDRLTAVMPPDYKDWHENSRQEWPLVAALTIENLTAQSDWAHEELSRSQAEVERLRYVLHRLEQAASELSNHDKTPGFRRTHAHWSRLHEGIGHARAALAAVGTETGDPDADT